MKVNIGDLKPEANFLISRIAGRINLFFDNPASPQSANEHSITWVKKSKDIQDKIRSTKSSFVVVKEKADFEPEETANKVIFFSENPKLTFARICRKFFEQRKPPFIHQSAILSKEASVHASTGIGANCVIGKSTIGANCEIRANTIIGDEVTIGENVIIDYRAVLGSQGYGYYKNQENRPLMISSSLFSGLFGTKLPGPGSLFISQSFKYKKPVYVGDTITAEILVDSVNVNRRVVGFLTTCKRNGEVVVSGDAKIFVPKS